MKFGRNFDEEFGKLLAAKYAPRKDLNFYNKLSFSCEFQPCKNLEKNRMRKSVQNWRENLQNVLNYL